MPNDINQIVDGFIGYLKNINQLDKLPGIVELLNQRIDKTKKTAQVFTAVDLDNNEIEKISRLIKQKLGHELELEIILDKSLIAGIKINAEDKVLDLSLKNKLDQITNKLIN